MTDRHLRISKPDWQSWTVGIDWDTGRYACLNLLLGPLTVHWIKDPGSYYWTDEEKAATGVLSEIAQERQRQNEKWGEQNHPDGTGPAVTWIPPSDIYAGDVQAYFKDRVDTAAKYGGSTFRDILLEEVAEALAEDDPARLRTELIQVAAVAAQWAEAIDRRSAQVPNA